MSFKNDEKFIRKLMTKLIGSSQVLEPFGLPSRIEELSRSPCFLKANKFMKGQQSEGSIWLKSLTEMD